MEFLTAVVLGIVEGITEFLPISSTGHLILAGELLRFKGPEAETFEIFIQLGAILAVVVLYWTRFLGLIDFSSSGAQAGFRGKDGIIKLALGCLPAFVAGALLHKTIKTYLFSSDTVAAALVVGGVIMIAVERRKRASTVHELGQISYGKSFAIGLFQCAALWPGISRAGATIVGALLLGLDRKTAAEFSFLLAVPVMVAAVGFDLLKSYGELSAASIPFFAAGFVTAFIFAALAIRSFLALLGRWTLVPFGVYRIVIAALVLWLL